mgnify:CR=1 FL=1
MAFNTYSEQKRLNGAVKEIHEDPTIIITPIDKTVSIESGMNKSTDNEKSKKQITEALY